MAGKGSVAYPFGPQRTPNSRGSSPLPPSARQLEKPYEDDSIADSTTKLLPPQARGSYSSRTTSSFNSQSSLPPSISDKFSFGVDPTSWGTELLATQVEPDDNLHTPDPRRDRNIDSGGTIFTVRGLANLGFLLFLLLALLTLFAGYPIISYFIKQASSTLGAYNLGGTNSTGQVPVIAGHYALVDEDTPSSAQSYTSATSGTTYELVFSDEFNLDNRTFYEGDDPYWEAVHLWYGATEDLEFYDQSAVVTTDGYLQITMTNEETYGLDYKSGMVTSWNKFCFTEGYIEVNVSLPGQPTIGGFWPAIWMMGNLGRAGYGATTDGMWPYSYDSCDWGTLPNQTYGDLPAAALTGNDAGYGGALSYLTGQRLSACTCPGDPYHPGPQNSDGTFVGRSAPEIDVFEATLNTSVTPYVGQVSQSCQFAPFDYQYYWGNTSGTDYEVYNDTITWINGYKGGVYQEATSGLTNANQLAYEETNGWAVYGVEYAVGDDGYVTWISDSNPTWSVYPSAVGPNEAVNISSKIIPNEPMYILMNFGMSYSFVTPSPDLQFPAHLRVDYVRVYQEASKRNVGCSPSAYPTEQYINTYIDAFSNPNLTTFSGNVYGSYNQTLPQNSITDPCSTT